MAAKDYSFHTGIWGSVYLAKNTKSKTIMSQDRRVITENELLGLFEFYVLSKCELDKCRTFGVSDGNGEEIFEVKLSDKQVELLKERLKSKK